MLVLVWKCLYPVGIILCLTVPIWLYFSGAVDWCRYGVVLSACAYVLTVWEGFWLCSSCVYCCIWHDFLRRKETGILYSCSWSLPSPCLFLKFWVSIIGVQHILTQYGNTCRLFQANIWIRVYQETQSWFEGKYLSLTFLGWDCSTFLQKKREVIGFPLAGISSCEKRESVRDQEAKLLFRDWHFHLLIWICSRSVCNPQGLLHWSWMEKFSQCISSYRANIWSLLDKVMICWCWIMSHTTVIYLTCFLFLQCGTYYGIAWEMLYTLSETRRRLRLI